MKEQVQTNEKAKPRKLFGIQNPLLKALVLIAFVLLTGGLGLIVVLIGWLGDSLLDKRKKAVKGVAAMLFLSALITMAATSRAQTWTERQEMYNQMNNQRQELFLQQEEMMRLQQEQERAIQEQRREMELQSREIESERNRPDLWGYR